MNFSWLSSDRGHFAWLFSNITESYKPEAINWWNDECKTTLSSSASTSDVMDAHVDNGGEQFSTGMCNRNIQNS